MDIHCRVTAKDYCSKVCGAKCCLKAEAMLAPAQCPQLGDDNLCRIYEDRLGFTFPAVFRSGDFGHCRCSPIKVYLRTAPEEIKRQCCYHDPSLLDE